jgi:hydrogenase-4 component B
MSPGALPGAALAVGLALASAALSLGAGRCPSLLRRLALPLFGLSGLAALAAGALALGSGAVARAELPLGLPWLAWQVRLDALAGVFLCLIGVLAAAVAVFATGYVRGFEQGRDSLEALGGCSGLFLAAMLTLVLADDALLFMVAWEVMSLASYFLVVFHHDQPASRRAGFLYLLMAQVGGLAILLGFGVLAAFGQGFEFAALRGAGLTPAWATVAFGLALFGFGMKAGLVPLHIWLPEAHPAAPAHISALMSGVMLKVAVYGFIRFAFDLLGPPQWQWGVAALALGSVSALYGVLMALLQSDLKRLLAWSSVENLGIVFIGLGLALVFAGRGHPDLAALALVAALLHAINHGLFKGLLFLGAGAIHHSTHEQDLEQMGGLLRRLPWTGTLFLIGCLSIAGLPPFNGFASEWLSFQAALQAWHLEGGVLRSLIPISAAVLALTGALAAACFVKVYGIAFLGQARSRHVRRARPGPRSLCLGQGLLAICCLAAGLLPGAMIEALAAVPAQLLGSGLPGDGGGSWLWLAPVPAAAASYSAPGVALLLAAAIAATVWALRRGTPGRTRRGDAWDCGFGALTPRTQYSAAAFAQPMRRVFALLFEIEETLETGEPGQARYRLRIADRFWRLGYGPLARAVNGSARRVALLQSGSVRTYLGWTLGTLVILLWIIS